MNHEKKEDVVRQFSTTTGKVSAAKPRKWVRTCMQCNENFYDREEFKAHMLEAHDKRASKANMDGTRRVDIGFKKAAVDVPEEVLVKSKQPKEKPAAVAPTRKRRKAADKEPEQPQEESKPKRRGRRKKTEE